MNYGDIPQNDNFALDQENLSIEGGNWNTANQGNMAPEHDPRAIGSKIISAPESTPEQSPTLELGQITPVMPPDYSEPTPNAATPDQSLETISFRRSNIMHGDNLSSKAVDALRDNERELSATGDAAAFFDKITAAREQFQGKETTA